MYRYLVIDGMLNGTGLRDYYEGGYIDPLELNLSQELITLLRSWLLKYWDAFYMNYPDSDLVENLDAEGVKIAQLVQKELNGKVWYYSDAKQEERIV
jgi:hypothetical protein